MDLKICGEKLFNLIREESTPWPIPSVSPSTGKFLEMLACLTGARNIVEVGCANGYATGYLVNAAVRNNGRVTAFEKDARRFEMISQNMAPFIANGVLEVISGDAVERLKESAASFSAVDFLFIDAMKRQYREILESFLPFLKKGAVVFSDDIYFQGVLEPEKTLGRHKSIVEGLRRYLDYLKELEMKGAVRNYFFGYEDGMSVTQIL